LIEDYAEKLNIKAIKEIEKSESSFGDAFNEQNLWHKMQSSEYKNKRKRNSRATRSFAGMNLEKM
jgi:glycyl-tRNA synthetase